VYCNNCGTFFSEYEVVEKKGELGETLMCCPICGVDDISETETCQMCEKEFTDGEVVEGYCLSCLWNAIDYSIALDYIKSEGYLAEFMIGEWFGGGKLEHSSPELDRHLEETFKRMVADDKLLRKTEFLAACRLFCLPGWPRHEFGIEGQMFAEWYKDYTDKKKTKL